MSLFDWYFGKGVFNESRLVLLSPFGWPGRIGALLATLLVLYLAVRATKGDTRRRRLTLLALRMTGLLATLVLFFQPALKLRNVTRMPNHIAVLVDASSSMQLADDSDGQSRAARVAQFLQKDRSQLAALSESHILDYYSFGERLSPIAGSDLTTPEGLLSTASATRIREALAFTRQRYEGRDLAGVVMFSDGIDNGRLSAGEEIERKRTAVPGQPALAPVGLDADTRSFLHALDAPVHTLAMSKPGLRDLAIRRVLADQFAFARTAVEIEAHIEVHGAEAAGWQGRHVPVTLRQDGQPVVVGNITLLPGQTDYRVTLPFTPERVGKFLYDISVPPLPGEAITANNQRSFVLRVVRDKIRVVHVAGRPTWDVRFLRGLLKHDPNIDLVAFFILRSTYDSEFSSTEETSLIPFPCEELFQEQLRSFDLVILHNFNYSAFCSQYLQPAIVPFVTEWGGAVAMLGGDLSFSSGGYYSSELSQIMPVVLLPDDLASGPLLVSTDPFVPRLTPAGRSHVITALNLDVRENAAHWDSLPALDGLNLVARARPPGTVLLAHPKLKDDSGNPMPVLTVAEIGRGRTLALQSDSTWHWGFGAPTGRREATVPPREPKAPHGDAAPGTASPPGGASPAASVPSVSLLGDERQRGDAYQRFWTQAIRWLVHDPSLRQLRVETTETEYTKNQPVRAELRAFGADYRPAPRIEITVSLTQIASEQSIGTTQPAPPTRESLTRSVRTDDEGTASVEWEGLPPGGYRMVARAVLQGRPAEDTEIFLVRGASRELDSLEGDDQLLRLVSQETGGEARRYTDSLAGLPFHPPTVVRVNQQHEVDLWHNWLVLLVLIVAFACDYTLRRRWGYA